MPKTVMIVDDAPSVRQVVGMALKGAGYEVVEARDGKDGVAKLDGRKVNLVICDLNMPNLDGIGFLKQIKTMEVYRFTPVIMLTTEDQQAKKEAGRAAGAKAWIVKPFNPPQLLDVVSKLILP